MTRCFTELACIRTKTDRCMKEGGTNVAFNYAVTILYARSIFIGGIEALDSDTDIFDLMKAGPMRLVF